MKRLLASIPLLFALLLVSCGNSDDEASSPAPSTPAAAQGSQAAPSTGANATGALPKVRLERAFGNLSFQRITGMYTAPDGRNRLFVTEQAGRIQVFDSAAASPQAAVYLDITDRVDAASSEMGLLGLAFPPDFRTSGAFYVNYTTSANGPRRTVISRFTEGGNQRSNSAPNTETVLMEIEQPFANHNGGQLAFGPDGMLYIGMGDGGSGNDPQGHGQNRRSLLGKILRIDVGGTNGAVPYRVPADNPFVNQSAGARVEIWAYGLRNPWRFSFDSQGGTLWVADVGQNAREEIDIVEKGGNYGWNTMEGSSCRGGGDNCNKDGLKLPVFDYQNGGGDCSVTGGFVYRGERLASLRGAYVYGDYCSGKIWGLRFDGSKITEQSELVDSDIQITSFAVDTAGEIYALQGGATGGIWRIAP